MIEAGVLETLTTWNERSNDQTCLRMVNTVSDACCRLVLVSYVWFKEYVSCQYWFIMIDDRGYCARIILVVDQ